jgi:transposase InsO family protein
MVTPAAKREAVGHLRSAFEVSERRACTVIGADRTSVRYRVRRADDEPIRARLRELALERRRFGYRRLHVLLTREGLLMNRLRLQPPGEHHHAPALRILARQLINQRAEPPKLGAGLHPADDAAYCGGEVLRHRTVTRHIGELRLQRVRTAGECLQDANLGEPVELLDRLGDHADKLKLS